MTQPKPPSKDATQRDAAAATPLPGGQATDVGRTLIQTPGSQFSAFLAPPQGPDEIGRLGGFRILRLIGQGGMGFVFEGQDVKLERRVAIKVMRSEVASHPEAAGRFLREARTAAALASDHVVTIYQVDEQNGVPFLVMPLMAGETLHDRLNRERLSLAEAIRFGRECAQGLAAAHDAGLIHRDIKPANLWLESPTGRVKILDFGLARAATGSNLTQSGQVLGTPQYMAPEQARGKVVDGRADLFSLGAVLYRMATGREAFSGDDIFALLTSLAVDDPTPPREIDSAVPPALSALIMKLLSKDASQRPESAAQVAAALRAIEAGDPTAIVPPRPQPATMPIAARRRSRWIVALPAAVLGGVLLAFIARFALGPPASSTPAPSSALVVAARPEPAIPKQAEPPPVEAPKVNPPIPKPGVVRLSPLAPVTIEAGKSTDLAIEIERERLPGEVTLAINGAPAGVEITPRRFAPGETKLAAKLTTSADAKPGTATITIVATSGTASDRCELPVTVRAPLVPKLTVSIPPTVRLKSGSATVVVVSVQREHVAGAVKLEWLDLPGGVRAAGAALIPATSDKAQATLAADYAVRWPGKARLRASVGEVASEQSIDIAIERVPPPVLDSTKGAIDAESVKKIQQNWADYLGKPLVETIALGNDTIMEFVLIPPGEFMMGSTPDDAEAYPTEMPRHKRRVLKPFYLGRTPVTKQQFFEFVRGKGYVTEAESTGEGGSGLDTAANQLVARNKKFTWRETGFPQFADCPVVNVTHGDALRFCDWLTTQQRVGKAHLPSEAQWEFACRAGGTARYMVGDDPDSLRGYANVSDQALKAKNLKGTERWKYFDFDDDAPFTSPVGHYRGNGFALRDMIGNVWQWCADNFDGGSYKTPAADERAWEGGDGKERVVRGGSWNNNARDTRPAGRDRNEPSDRQCNVGFRVALRIE